MIELYKHQSDVLNDTIENKKVGYYLDNYVVTKSGAIFNKSTGRKLKLTEHNGKQPYYYVTLSRHGKRCKFLVHRLVAMIYIPNPHKLPQVNHMDGDVHNNCVNNLEWVTNSENTQHAYDNFLNRKGQLHIDYKGEVHSLRKWCKILNLPYGSVWHRYKSGWSIQQCFEGKRVV